MPDAMLERDAMRSVAALAGHLDRAAAALERIADAVDMMLADRPEPEPGEPERPPLSNLAGLL